MDSPVSDVGLRERKKRETRQLISDIATSMFIDRGYDAVRIAEIAERAGVSEKTIYNYFPTKESLVFDHNEEQVRSLTAAVRDRAHGVSPTAAFVAELKQQARVFSDAVTDFNPAMVTAFGEMVNTTPALRAAWGEHRHQLVQALTDVLAADFEIDPRDPELVTAARALVSLVELFYDSSMRWITAELSAQQLRAHIESDLDRGARLIDTGMWSLHVLAAGRRNQQQLREVAIASEQARQQVLAALAQARKAWREIRDEAKAVSHQRRHDERRVAAETARRS